MKNTALENECIQAYNFVVESEEISLQIELKESLEHLERIFGKIEIIKIPMVNFFGYLGKLNYDGIFLETRSGKLFLIENRIDFGRYLSQTKESDRVLVNQ